MEPGDLIKSAREAKGWSQADLGRRVGISQPAVKKIEAGETRHSKFFPRICAELSLDITDLDPGMPKPAEGNEIIPQRKLMSPDRDFPVHASAEGGPGQMMGEIPDALDQILAVREVTPRVPDRIFNGIEKVYDLLFAHQGKLSRMRRGGWGAIARGCPAITFFDER